MQKSSNVKKRASKKDFNNDIATDTTEKVLYFEMELGDQDKSAAKNLHGEKQTSKRPKPQSLAKDKSSLEEVLRRPLEDYDEDESTPQTWSERHSIKNLGSLKTQGQTRKTRRTKSRKLSKNTRERDDSTHKESDLSAFSKLKGLKKSLHSSCEETFTSVSLTGSLKSKIKPTGIPEFDIPQVEPLQLKDIGVESKPKSFEKRSQQLTKKTARKMRKGQKDANFLVFKDEEPINDVRTAFILLLTSIFHFSYPSICFFRYR